MLHIWMEQNVFFYGMIGAGIPLESCVCLWSTVSTAELMLDVRRITEPKGKMDKEFFEPVPDASDERAGEINNPRHL